MLLLLVLPLLAPNGVTLPGMPAVCVADQILEIDNSSLTTYLESSTTNVQDVRPLVTQRGVNIDGSIRLRGGPGMALAGNPFGDGPGWTGNRMLNGMVELNNGTYSITEVDLALPSLPRPGAFHGFTTSRTRVFGPEERVPCTKKVNSRPVPPTLKA